MAYCKRAIQPAVDEKAVEKKTLRPRRKPKDRDEQRDQEEDLNETERDSRHGRSPEQRNARGVDRGDGEENERGNAQDRGDDRDEVRVELKAAKKRRTVLALQHLGGDQADGEKEREGQQPEERDIMPAHVKERLLEQGQVHLVQSVPLELSLQPRNKKTRPKPCFLHGNALR